jgi:hypothetical protein
MPGRRPEGQLDLGIGPYSTRTTVAVHGQKRPPPNWLPSRSTSDGRPSHSSIVTSAKARSTRCQLQPVFTCVPGTMRPIGIRAGPPCCAARAAATWSAVVNATRNASPPTENVATAAGDGDVGVSSVHAAASVALKRAAGSSDGRIRMIVIASPPTAARNQTIVFSIQRCRRYLRLMDRALRIWCHAGKRDHDSPTFATR